MSASKYLAQDDFVVCEDGVLEEGACLLGCQGDQRDQHLVIG